MDTQSVGYKAKAFEARDLAFFFLLALLLAACSSTTPSTVSQTPLPAGDVGGHTPIIEKVTERSGTKDGRTIIFEDITFTDPEGDAITIIDKTIWSNQGVTTSNVEIKASPDAQKNSATVTDNWGCDPDLLRIVETRILDKVGNLSEPVTITISCPRSQLPNLPPFLAGGLVIGIGLLSGTWQFLRTRPSERTAVFQSMILLFCLIFPLYFAYLFLHEGGHALTSLAHGVKVEILFAHPFAFMGYNMPPFDWNSALFHAGGVLVALPVSLLISLPFWKRRSVSNLPFVMLFPWVALLQGLRMLTVGGDFATITHLTRLPFIVFIVAGLLIVGVGTCLLISLLPLFGLAPDSKRSFLVLPTALLMWSAVGLAVAYFVVPGSPTDVQYRVTKELFNSSLIFMISGPVIGILLAALYRALYPKLPKWSRNEVVSLTWKDFRPPVVLAAVSVILGLIIIT